MKAKSVLITFFVIISTFLSTHLYSQIVINEFLAGNETINTDEDGEYEDWIELYNAGDDAVDLAGFTLTDDPTEHDQWTLPAVTLGSHEFLLVWASKKDRTTGELHTNFS
ncbi:hypothetical protein B6D60_05585, partial [candidate division KSB1 bacterium 4484_87]